MFIMLVTVVTTPPAVERLSSINTTHHHAKQKFKTSKSAQLELRRGD